MIFNFLKRYCVFLFVLLLIGEILVRFFHLSPDIPQREIDNNGIQKFKLNQTGKYNRKSNNWIVNDYGWLGVAQTNREKTVSVIGDSFIENIMNPIECNQGYLLSKKNRKIGFFEVGRSGLNFIEAMHISKDLEKELNISFHIIYVQNEDFKSSIKQLNTFTDQLQIDIENYSLIKPKLKYPKIKYVLYNFKLLYYLYLRFPILVEEQNVYKESSLNEDTENFDVEIFSDFIAYCANNYDFNNKLLVFHPESNKKYINIIQNLGFNVMELQRNGEYWRISENDSHWSCFGHNQVSNQVSIELINFLSDESK